jgi:hypothetical protein
VALEVAGAGLLQGELGRVGSGWCLLAGGMGEWLVPLDAVVVAHGLSDRSVPEMAWPAVARLGLGSALRRLADDASPCVVITRTGSRHDVVLQRVGADFVEADAVADDLADDGRRLVLALGSVGAVQRRPDRPE